MSDNDKNNKSDEIRRESLQRSQQRSELERRAAFGASGNPELKKEEKVRFLGEFKERVIKALTFSQIEEAGTYQEIEKAIKDRRATKLIIDRTVDEAAKDYIDLSRKHDLSFKRVHSPEFRGEVALVVVSDKAVHESDIFASREEIAKLPDRISKAKGQKICADCYSLVKEKAPDKLGDYQKLSIIDRLLARDCAAKREEV